MYAICVFQITFLKLAFFRALTRAEIGMATFGRRTNLPNVTAAHSAVRKPWLTWLLAGLLACAIGAGALFALPRLLARDDSPTAAIAAPDTTEPVSQFTARFLATAAEQPDEANRQMMAGVETCLPAAARPYWSGPIKALAADILVRSLALQYDEGPGVEQRNQEFRTWIQGAINGLTEEQQKQFKGLMDNGLNSMSSCLVATIYHAYKAD
jgi:hypothetical protein